ncbi:MAG: hypothetical protein SGILL_000165 [Bacillariaceae sp.]
MLPALARRGVYVPKVAVMAALSTQAEAAVSAAFNKAKWNDVADEVGEINKLMREGTTNHSVDLPSHSFERSVDEKLQGVRRLVEGRQHNEAFAQVHTLKGLVKDELYHHRLQQRKAFSTMTDQRVDAFQHDAQDLKWFDVEGDLEEIHHLMHEVTTNHAINAPDVELEQLIEKTINDIKQVIETSPRQHKLVYGQIHALKGFVKERLYHGTTSQAHVLAFENEMEALKWSDIKDEVEQIHQLMQEGTTNHAVALPSEELKATVDQGLKEIEAMIKTNPTPAIHAQVFDCIHKLKGTVKEEIYN